MTKQITVHIVANAHLDPVWLWPWQAGLDEVLCTCRTMCDLLDDYPDAIFTAGEAWRYRQIEAVEPALLERIRAHVDAGRWELTGGWWIQPDCNFPADFAMRKQIEAGKEYFQATFGQWPEVGYNVDSFGHMATLPSIMHAAGQKYYIMMRPQHHEMALPARLFRWREKPGAPEILTFRLASYGTWNELPTENDIRGTLWGLPEGVTHTMCFIGIGDHGGGPTAQMLDWVREHTDAFEGCRLEFSSPARFFAAISNECEHAPVVDGELQYHAVGCYSVMRGIKTRVRRAEHLLAQAETVARENDAADLGEAWQHVAFSHFHDILGGTSIASSYPQHYDQLGAAATVADTLLHQSLRRQMTALPDDPLQRVVVGNASDTPFEGFVEHEPWLRKHDPWRQTGRLLDESGNEVMYQRIAQEQVNMGEGVRILFRMQLAAGEMKTLRLAPEAAAESSTAMQSTPSSIKTADGTGISDHALSFAGGHTLPLPRLDVLDDRTDNWSHGVDRYPEGPVSSPVWDAPFVIDNGPLMASLGQAGREGESTFTAEWRVYEGEPWVEWQLAVHWRAHERMLKLTLPLPGATGTRTDGIPGGALDRSNAGRECPLHNWTLIPCTDLMVGIVSPDVYALDATSERVRLTLLRSPILTQHDPFVADRRRAVYADQGEHVFRLRFVAANTLSTDYLHRQALQMHRPPLTGDLTRGMPRAPGREN